MLSVFEYENNNSEYGTFVKHEKERESPGSARGADCSLWQLLDLDV